MSTLGGRDTFLASCYITLGVISALIATSFAVVETGSRRKHIDEKGDVVMFDFGVITKAYQWLKTKVARDQLIPDRENRILQSFWSKFVSIDPSFET